MTQMTILSILVVAVILINKSIAQNCQQTGCASGYCCSRWGFCGDTPLHCAGGQSNNTNGNTCNPPCGAGFCCSRWGFCGDTPLHCAGGQSNNTNGNTCYPPCGAGFCCSRWGFCGDTPLHCAGGQSNNTNGNTCNPPCGAGSCCSRWGFCGYSPLHCSGATGGTTVQPQTTTTTQGGATGGTTVQPQTTTTTQGGATGGTTVQPQTTTSTQGGQGETTMTRARFDCIFDQISPAQRDQRWQGYQQALSMVTLNPQNQDELMMFFAHVSHETDGLKTYEEYCAQAGQCSNNYQNSWCSVQAEPGKQYYGRGWFQLSYPCNYNAAGQALGVDFLKNPELVADSDAYAAATAIWFWNANNMGQAARNGNFGGTTQKINSIECGATPQQTSRIERYQMVRRCFGLNDATQNLRC